MVVLVAKSSPCCSNDFRSLGGSVSPVMDELDRSKVEETFEVLALEAMGTGISQRSVPKLYLDRLGFFRWIVLIVVR